jgi:outer membrane protein assembly factor BamB
MSLVVVSFLACRAHADETDGVVHQWRFDNAHLKGGVFLPQEGNLQPELLGNVQFADKAPRALVLDGDSKSGRRVRVKDGLAADELPAKTLTVEAWVLIDRPEKWGGIVSALQDNGDFERGWILGYNETQFYFGLASQRRRRLTYLNAASLFQTGYWYHVVGTYDGARQRIFVDGQLKGESTHQSGAVIYAPKTPFTIGAFKDDNEIYSMAGQIEQVAVWNRALSGEEVLARFDARKSRFPDVVAVRTQTDDWPTYLRDNQRTGTADSALAMPLKLAWRYRTRKPPAPAWPPPANQDFWHKKHGLKARVTYDHFFHLVSSGDAVYFTSSSEDKVCCLDAETGALRWQAFAAAPVRLAPTIAGDRVIFGSDDGCVYCVGAADGKLIWKYCHAKNPRWIAGNGRLMSDQPVRTGVLVEGNVAHFCTGLFPGQGISQVAIDIRNGKHIASGPVNVSAQGYLQRRAGRLFVATGRDPAGSFITALQRRGKDVSKEVQSIPADYPYTFVSTGGQRFGGGSGKVAAFDAKDGREIWSTKVEGRAGSIAIARGRLLVSTDKGVIYCFTPTATKPVIHDPPVDNTVPAPDFSAAMKQRAHHRANAIIEQTSITDGYALVLECGTGGTIQGLNPNAAITKPRVFRPDFGSVYLLEALATKTRLKVIGLVETAQEVAMFRILLDYAGLSDRVAVIKTPDKKLPFSDYLFNLVVCANSPRSDWIAKEARRVVRPGGVSILSYKDENPQPIDLREKIPDGGEWSHLYANAANTACSLDQHVGGPMKLQWFGRPGPQQMVDRHHRTVAPLFKAGRLFVPGDSRVVGVDAYNGTILWNTEVPDSRRVGVMRDCGSMAATDDAVFIATKNECWALDAQSGKRTRTFEVPAATDNKLRHWGYTATVGETLFGSATRPGASRTAHSRRAIEDGIYWDFRPIVTSDYVFAMNRKDGQRQWRYQPPTGAIINPSITIGGDRVYFVECTGEVPASGRVHLHKVLKQPANLVALATATGKEIWRRELDLSAMQHQLFGAFSDEVLVLVGSRNDGADRNRSRVWYELMAFNGRTGKPIWAKSQNNQTKIGGDHGEQDHHPVIIGNRLLTEPYSYELKTGKPLDLGWNRGHRRGCGTISASACALFFRDEQSSMFDLEKRTHSKVTQVTRPGCWINMIPAGGLLLIPEASSGCTCNFAVQTSMAFLPTAATETKKEKP